MKEGWKYSYLDNLCTIVGRIGFRGYTKADLVSSPDEGAITLSPSNIINGELDFTKCSYINWDKYNESPEIMLYKGDVVLVKTASIGKCAVVRNLPHETTLNPQFVVLKDLKLNSEFITYFIKSPAIQEQIIKMAGGVAIPTLSQKKLGTLEIPLPPLSEQQEIVTYLDSVFEKIDRLKENAEKSLSDAKALFQSALKEMMQPKDGWEEKTIKEIGTVIGGTTPSTTNKEYWGGNNCWISPAELDGSRYLYDSVKKITDLAVQSKSLKLLPVGTVILSSRAPIGKVTINKVPTYCNQGFKCVICGEKVFNEFLYWWFWGNTEYLNSLGTGATFKEISKTVVENIAIPVPPIPEQENIASTLDALSEKVSALEANYTKTIAECNALKQALLKQVFE